LEEEYGLTRSLLTALKDHDFPCHILTKSPLVLRDRSLIASFDCMVSVSLLSSEPMTARLFEPQAPSPQERLTTVQQLREAGVTAGVAVIPVLPLLTDGPQLETTIAAAAAAHARYAVHKHLELRGEQRDRFFAALKYEHPRVLERYHMWYNNGVEPDASYIKKLQERFNDLCIKYDISHSIQ
jgi:DNA repair photolyase